MTNTRFAGLTAEQPAPGVTGQQGKATVNALLKHHAGKFHIRCVVRNPDALKGVFPEGSVEIVKGDQMDKASLVRAFQGAEKGGIKRRLIYSKVRL